MLDDWNNVRKSHHEGMCSALMISGGSGLGKTHLLHAVGHYIRSYYDRVRVKYVSTEELTNDFINSISENRTAEFRRAYRDVDVLLVDDLQFLQDTIQTQEEFFHTFNTLHTARGPWLPADGDSCAESSQISRCRRSASYPAVGTTQR